MEFSRQEYWSRLPFPSSGDLLKTRTEPVVGSLPAEPLGTSLLEQRELSESDQGHLQKFTANIVLNS